MKIKVAELKKLVSNALKKQGYSTKEIETIRDILLYAQLRGNNQGIVKLIGTGIPKNRSAGTPKLVKKSSVSALLDGKQTFGMLVMDQQTDLAISKAKKSGIGLVGSYNSAGSTGAIGYYVDRIAKKGLLGIAFSSAPFQTTAPYGSTEALFCTNPMAFGTPTQNDPIILDMTTSTMAYYGLIQSKTAGIKVSKGIGYDKRGKDTTDPAAIMEGALRTFGGHKGYGLALMVQIFAGALVQADSFNSDSDNSGNLVLAIKPEILTSKSAFLKETTKIVKRIKSAKKLVGVSEIMLPGERGNKLTKERLKSGTIEVEDNLLRQLQTAAS